MTAKRATYRIKLFIISLVLGFMASASYAQDVEQSVKSFKERLAENPILFSGSFTANLNWNTISLPESRRDDPFNLNLFGQANLDILGVQAPFSIALSDGNSTYSLPAYSFVGVSPSYKWAKLLLFQRSMSFSKYSLNGHGFNGVGMELTPGNWHVSGMYGRLRKARQQDFGLRQELDPFYKRIGMGGKVGYAKNQDHIYLSLFKASDDENSIQILDSTSTITAQENVVITVDGKKKISEVLTLQAEYAYSILTRDKLFSDRPNLISQDNLANVFMDINGTTRYSSAYNFGILFSPGDIGDLSLNYERVNPLFKSLGSLHFQNDFENVTASYRGRIKKKYTVAVRGGLQRNNLDNREIENRVRFVGSVNVGIPISQKWSSQFSFTNFTQTTRLLDRTNPLEVVDSVFLGSSNRQVGLQSQYLINESQSLSLFVSLQNANTIQNDLITQNSAVIRNMSLVYSFRPKESSYYGSVSMLYSLFNQQAIESSTLSPSITVGVKPSEKINLSLNLNSNFSSRNGAASGNIFRATSSGSYRINEKQQISLRMQVLKRSNTLLNNYTEFLGQIGYSLAF